MPGKESKLLALPVYPGVTALDLVGPSPGCGTRSARHTAGSRRTLALPAQLVDALRVHRAAEQQERAVAGPVWEDHGLVFPQPSGRPIERTSDWHAWKALLREARRARRPAARRAAHRSTAAPE